MSYTPDLPFNDLPDLPPQTETGALREVETPEVLRSAIRAHRSLAELKGTLQRLPNPELLLNTLILQESRESSAIENIVTTQDELFRAAADWGETPMQGLDAGLKEVLRYREAMYSGLADLRRTGGLSTNGMVRIMQTLRATREGIRRTPGTKLMTPQRTVIYTPPEGEALLRTKLAALERFLAEAPDRMDPLVVMALGHYQFEAIHPFTDGNGRTGRILNVLFLVQHGLLSFPALYLSAYIHRHRTTYYRCLRAVTEEGAWERWVEYLLDAVAATVTATLARVNALLETQQAVTDQLRAALPHAPIRELGDLLFAYPYVRIRMLENRGVAKRQTASAYLYRLVDAGVLAPEKVGRDVYFLNRPLRALLSQPLL